MAARRVRALLPQFRELVSRFDDQTSDRELLRRFAEGRDETAFTEVVRRHGPMLLRVCQRVLHGGPDAEDVCQAAFLLLAQKATSDRWRDSVAGWLFQAAYRLSLKARTAARRRARHETQTRPVSQPDPVAELTVRELQAVLDDELSRLPEKYRAPILLCCLEGRSRDEAARYLGWQLAAVKDRLEQGRERLRVRLARRGVQVGTALVSSWLFEGGARAGCPNVAPQATAKAALSIATGQATLAGLLPARVAALAKGMTTTMLLRHVIILAAVGPVLGLGAAGAVKGLPGESPSAQAQVPSVKSAAADRSPVQPEAMPLVGHWGAVRAVAFAPGGKFLATAGGDKTVRVWDLATGRQVHELEQRGEAVGVAFSPDGKVLFCSSAGRESELTRWDVATGEQAPGVTNRSLRKMRGRGFALAVSPDGKTVAAGLGDCTVVVDGASGVSHYNFRGEGGGTTAAAFSPDSKRLAYADDGPLGKGTVYLQDAANPKRSHLTWRGKGATVTALAFLPGGAKLAAVDGGRAVRMLDATVVVEGRGLEGNGEEAFKGKEAVRALAFSADGKWAATAGASGVVVVWDAAADREERRFRAEGAVNAVAFSPDGKRLVTAGSGGAVVWDLTRDEKPLPRDLKLTAKELDSLWADLASDEGGRAWAAERLLRADPARSVPFLRDHLKPKAEGPDGKKLKQLIADLDAEEFSKREAATKELERLGPRAESALRAALAAGPQAEVKIRVERLLKLVDQGRALTAGQRRDVRAVHVLEQAGTPEAEKLLERLVNDSLDWSVVREAKEANQRLARRDKRR
jgi:RNA polymerase sigma factor (sigma-70 family)